MMNAAAAAAVDSPARNNYFELYPDRLPTPSPTASTSTETSRSSTGQGAGFGASGAATTGGRAARSRRDDPGLVSSFFGGGGVKQSRRRREQDGEVEGRGGVRSTAVASPPTPAESIPEASTSSLAPVRPDSNGTGAPLSRNSSTSTLTPPHSPRHSHDSSSNGSSPQRYRTPSASTPASPTRDKSLPYSDSSTPYSPPTLSSPLQHPPTSSHQHKSLSSPSPVNLASASRSRQPSSSTSPSRPTDTTDVRKSRSNDHRKGVRDISLGRYENWRDEDGAGLEAPAMDRDPTVRSSQSRRQSGVIVGDEPMISEGMLGAPSIEDIIRAYTTDGVIRPAAPSSQPLPPSHPPSSLPIPSHSNAPTHIKSIAEIIAEHLGGSSSIAAGQRHPQESPTPAQIVAAAARSRESSNISVVSDTSGDELGDEIAASLQHMELYAQDKTPATPQRDSIRIVSATNYAPSGTLLSTPTTLDEQSDSRSTNNTSTPRQGSPSFSTAPIPHDTPSAERELATFLKSPRLTRLVTLRQASNAGVVVSLADVGLASGHPVLVFLGLGCVRWLVALYDELATTLGLRLICLDRWGLGKTTDVPDSRRGFLEWASVVEEVVQELGLDQYSILAHSAGAPYALATALREPRRVQGAIHLLAPWVPSSSSEGTSDSLAGAYKYIKYVPSGVIRTAQAAEWKMMAWKLGKPPSVVHEGVGYDRRAPVSSEDVSGEDGDEVTGEYLVGKVVTGGKAVRGKSGFLGGLFGGGSDRGHKAGSENGAETASIRSDSSRRSPSTPESTLRSSTQRRISLAPLDCPLPSSRRDLNSSGSSSSPSSPTSLGFPPSSLSPTDLTNGLLRASHAESLRGTTSDLLVLLDRTARPWGFKYSDVETGVKVWIGTKDERIGLGNVKALEGEMKRCTVEVVEGADHSLMTNGRVMIEALESILADWEGTV